VAFTPTNTAKFLPASATVVIDVAKAPQAALTVTGAPATQENGTSFSVGSSGGSGTGAVTFSTSGVCTNAGASVTMTSATGTCSITAAKAGDANYLPVVSAVVIVGATGAVPPTLDILEVSGFLAVLTQNNVKTGIPGTLSIRLQSNGVSVAAPGAVPFTATSDNLSCVTVTSGTIASGAYGATVPIAYGGTLTLPCQAVVTIATASFGTEFVPVNVFDYATAPFTSGATSLSYYNPALLANAAGLLGTNSSSLSYYNPATIPNPTGALFASSTALSYYNPALLPSPSGASVASTASLSYYNPADVPSAAGIVAAGAASLSYCNPDEVACFSSSGFAASAVAARPADETTVASAVFSVSIANGPTAIRVTPPRLSRTAAGVVTLTVHGVNLSGATGVRLIGLEQDATVGTPVVSTDGRSVTVDVFVLPSAPLGGVPVVITGPGWSTSVTTSVQVEIVQ
jgi:trimeric autotransporter adhesin